MVKYKLSRDITKEERKNLEAYFLTSPLMGNFFFDEKKQELYLFKNELVFKNSYEGIEKYLKDVKLEKQGYAKEIRMELELKNVSCRNIAKQISKKLRDAFTFIFLEIDLSDDRLRFSTVDSELIIDPVNKINEIVKEITSDAFVREIKEEKKTKKDYRKILKTIFYSLGLLLLGIGFTFDILSKNGYEVFKNPFYLLCFYIPAYLAFAYPVFIKTFKDIARVNLFSETFLIILATVAAFVIGHYSEAVLVVLLYEVGEYLQDSVYIRAQGSISKANSIIYNDTVLVNDSEEIKTPVSLVKPGDILVLKAGETLALDCLVINGSGVIDTSKITGEARPVKITTNEYIYSGSLLTEGYLTLKVVNEYKQSFSSKIEKIIEEATAKKAKTENVLNKFASIYTPIVCLLAVLISLMFLYGDKIGFPKMAWQTSLYNGLVFIVASCPCALIISIPIAFYGGIVNLMHKGILVKELESLDRLGKIKALAFDKTGTLTKGEFIIGEVKNYTEEDSLKWAAVAETVSGHPIAMAIKNSYHGDIVKEGVTVNKDHETTFPSVSYEGHKVRIGNYLSYQNSYNLDLEESDFLYVMLDDKIIGHLDLTDEIKHGAEELVSYFKKRKIKTYIFTGDSESNTQILKDTLKPEKIYARLSPADKETKVLGLPKKSAFVGDGVNDALALRKAYLGISMGKVGSDVSVTASNVVILNDHLHKIKDAYEVSKKVNRTVLINIVFVFLIKIIVLTLATLGYAYMWLSLLADVGVAIIAIFHSLSCLGVKNVFSWKNKETSRNQRGTCHCHHE